MELASRSARLLGQIIDGLIAVTPFIVSALVVDAEATLGTTFALSTLVFGVGYYLFADALPEGQSWGKSLLGLAVIDQHSNAPCSGFQSFVRNILQPILGVLDWIFIIGSGSGRQRLGDMVAGTIVVEKASIGNAKEWSGDSHSTTREWVTGSILAALIVSSVVAAMMSAPASDAPPSYLTEPEPDAAGLAPNPTIMVSTDGQSQITAPGSWGAMSNLNELAEIQAGSIADDQFLFALTESKAAGTSDVTLQQYAYWTVSQIRGLDEDTVSAGRLLTIQDQPAIQYLIRTRYGGASAVFWVTVIETPFNFHRIIAWTNAASATAAEPQIQAVIQSFREIAPREQAPCTRRDRAVSAGCRDARVRRLTRCAFGDGRRPRDDLRRGAAVRGAHSACHSRPAVVVL